MEAVMLSAILLTMLEASGPPNAAVKTGASASFAPFDVVGVCAIKSSARSWGVVWHPHSKTPDAAATRVFRHLEAQDFNDCLTLLIESDELAREAADRFGSSPTAENAELAVRAAHRRWESYGVDRAILEVAETGARGAAVERVLASCKQIRFPLRIIGAPKEEGK